MRRHPLALLVLTLAGLALACGGGENTNEQGAGSKEGGVALGVGDIAVSTDGSYVVFAYGEGMARGWTQTGALDLLPVAGPSRLAFANTSPTLFVGQETLNSVVAIDASTGALLWEQSVGSTAKEVFRIDVSEDDGLLVVHDDTDLRFLDPATGELLYQSTLTRRIVDVDLYEGRAFIVEAELWMEDQPWSRVIVLDTRTWQSTSFDVPNCAATLSLMPLAGRAFMAPTTCSQDPVSVISLLEGEEGFEKNLPGFGPVAVAPDGWTAVAFYARSQGDERLFEDPSAMPGEETAEYHLMLIDGADLGYSFVEYGDTMPRYTISPDGQVILVDSAFGEAGTTLFDLATGAFRTVEGPTLHLDNYALASDGSAAWALQTGEWAADTGLFALDLVSAVARELPVDFLPTNFNLSPDDATLFLRESSTRVCVYALSAETCQAWFDTAELES